jgi:dethiobiotin synthetase
LRQQGYQVRVCKPVATGAKEIDGCCISEDTVALAQAASQTDLSEITPWAFPEPVAPSVAARRHGLELELNAIVAAVRRNQGADTIVLVEGVGGLLCPMTEKDTVAELAKALDLPVLIVARRTLGTLNHTLLTLEAARARGLRLAGLVVNETEPCAGLAAESNVEELRQRIGVDLLAVVPFGGKADVALSGVDWPCLMGKARSVGV